MAGTVRENIAEKISTDNAGYIVKAFPTSPPDNLAGSKVFVNVYRETLTNTPQTASVAQQIKITVLTSTSGTDTAENELEDALYNVLVSIASLNYVQWTTAERSTFYEKYIGYEISLESHTENIYKPSAS